MKKIFSVLLCAVILAVSFSACSGKTEMTEDNVTKSIDKAITALIKFDSKDMEKYIESATLSTIMNYADSHEQFAELGRAIFANLEYEITNIDIENKTVTLSVKNKDLYEVAADVASNLKSDYSTFQLAAKLSDDRFLDRKLAAITQSIDAAPMQEEATEITLEIAQGDKNLYFVFDENAENAASGGALGAIKDIFLLG